MGLNRVDPLADVPLPAGKRLALRVTPAAQRALRQGHPWLFDQAIIHQSREGQPGDLAAIFDDRRRFLAVGLYDPTSPIRVRLLHHGTPRTIDRAWLNEQLSVAAARRAELPATGTTGYRLVHGENDGLGGLVIDRYEDTLVVKLYTPAWVPWLTELRTALTEVCPTDRIILRLNRGLRRRPEYLYGQTDGTTLLGSSPIGPVLFSENGLCFEADVLHGQKTGFFLDQRENRARVEKLSAGRRVLDVFSCSGGFSLYAARGGTTEVLSIDVSAGALAAAERNFVLNHHLPTVTAARHSVRVADAFAALRDLNQRKQQFDLVIVDPPAFAKRKDEIGGALQAYGQLVRLVLGVLPPGGLLVMASCSSRVSAEDFYTTVNRTAIQAGRPLIEIERTGHPIDHPIRFPEGAYLKCLFATVT